MYTINNKSQAGFYFFSCFFIFTYNVYYLFIIRLNINLSILAILGGAKLATIFIILSLPITDAILTILNRLKNGHSPFWGDRKHLHHYLLDKYHWNKIQISLFYCLVSLIMGLLALVSNSLIKFIILIFITLLSFIILLIIKKDKN